MDPEEVARVSEFRAHKGSRMVAKFDDLWSTLETKAAPGDAGTNRMHEILAGPSLHLQLAPRV